MAELGILPLCTPRGRPWGPTVQKRNNLAPRISRNNGNHGDDGDKVDGDDDGDSGDDNGEDNDGDDGDDNDSEDNNVQADGGDGEDDGEDTYSENEDQMIVMMMIVMMIIMIILVIRLFIQGRTLCSHSQDDKLVSLITCIPVSRLLKRLMQINIGHVLELLYMRRSSIRRTVLDQLV